MIPLTILTLIEEAAVRAVDGVFSGAMPGTELADRDDIVLRSDAKKSIRPSVEAATLSGTHKRLSSKGFSSEIVLSIRVTSTHPLDEAHRRSELYPVLMAVMFLFAGYQLLSSDGKQLPVKPLEPNGKWGQATEEGEYLGYVITFLTEIQWQIPDEIGLYDLKAEIGYLLKPGDEVVDALDIVE